MNPNQNPTCTCAFDHDPGCPQSAAAVAAWGWCQAFLDVCGSNDEEEPERGARCGVAKSPG